MKKILLFVFLFFALSCSQKAEVKKEKKISEYELLRKQLIDDFNRFLDTARCIQKKGNDECDIEF